jgi:hypothetical protein
MVASPASVFLLVNASTAATVVGECGGCEGGGLDARSNGAPQLPGIGAQRQRNVISALHQVKTYQMSAWERRAVTRSFLAELNGREHARRRPTQTVPGAAH